MGRSATALMGVAGAVMLGLFAAHAIPTRPAATGDDWRDRYGASDNATNDFAAQDDEFFSQSIAIPSGPPAWLFGDDTLRKDVPVYAPDYAAYNDGYDDSGGDGGALRSATYTDEPQVADRAEDAAIAAESAARDIEEAEAQPAQSTPAASPEPPAPMVASAAMR